MSGDTLPLSALSLLVFLAAVLCAFGAPVLLSLLQAQAERCRRHHEALFEFSKTGKESVWLALGAGAGLGGFFWLVGSWVWGIPMAVLGYLGPEYLLVERVRQRHERIQGQIDEAMTSLVNSLKAGLTLIQAIEECCQRRTFPQPIIEEFRIAVRDYALGTPAPDVLNNLKDRIDSRDFDLICSAILVSQKQGGNLTDTLVRITAFMREINRLKEALRTKTAQGRKAAQFMRFVPLVILGGLYIADPQGVQVLFSTVIGNGVLALAVAFNFAAYYWTKSIIETEI